MRGTGAIPVFAACLLLGPAAAHAQHNPNGWIQTSGWNLLWPLRHDGGCNAGGAENMLRNWVAPHDVGVEDPRAGDVWDDIEFGEMAAATGFGGDPVLGPTWFTTASLAARFPGITWPVGDLVNFQDLSDSWNANNDPGEPLAGIADVANDNVLGIATTYVRNTTLGILPVHVCGSSDDSMQVWLNGCLVVNFSHCAPSHECDGFAAVDLPPGTSKIAVLVWEGGGGWGFRLSIRRPGSLRYRDGDPEIEFLGPGASETTPARHDLSCEIVERIRIGDENVDGDLNISDPVAVLNHLFSARNPTLPCGDGTLVDPANVALLDVNGTNTIDIADPVYFLSFLFNGGPPPRQCGGIPCRCVRIVGCPSTDCVDG